MKKFLMIGAALALAIPAFAELPQPVVSPETNTSYTDEDAHYYVNEIQEVTLTFPGYEIELSGKGSIRVEDGNFNYTTLTDEYYEIDGSTLTIKYPFSFKGLWTIYIPASTLQEKDNARNTNSVIRLSYNIYDVQLESTNLSSNPPFGQSIISIGPKITVTAPGWTITPEMADPSCVRFFQGQAANYEGMPENSVTDVEIVGNSCVITLPEEYTANGQYTLGLAAGAFYASNDNYTDVTFGEDAQATLLYYEVSGYQLSPASNSVIENFYGVTILGENVEILNPGSIKIYSIYYGGDPEELKDYNENEITVARGAKVSDNTVDGMEGKLLTFDFEPYNGPFTVAIPYGCVTVNGQNVGAINYHIMIEGKPMSMPEVSSQPANNSQVASLSNIKVAVGLVSKPNENVEYDFYGQILSATSVPAVLTLPDGTQENVLGFVTNVLDNGVDTPSIEGSFINFMFDKTYTTLGKYSLYVAPGAFRITPNKYNDFPNDAFTLYYEITDGYSYSITPENGSEIKSLDGETITVAYTALNSNYDFSKVTKVSLNLALTADSEDILLSAEMTKDAQGNWYYVVPENAGANLIEGLSYTATFVASTDDNSNYLTLSAEWVGTYVESPVYPVITEFPVVMPENDSTVALLTSVSITWGLPLVINETCEETPTLNRARVNGTASGEFLNFNFTGLTNGTYTLIVPEGYVIVTDEDGEDYYNQQLVLNYKQDKNSGVATITVDSEGFYHVYNLNGQQVKITKETSELNSLGKGVYIINGQKTVVK